MADMNDPDVVAYLKALYAQSQQAPAASSAGLDTAPFDAGLTQANNAADLNYNNTVAGLDQVPGALRRQYGYTESGDIDPSNPFGKAQLLQRTYDQAQKGNTNSYASRGQLYSGALQRRKDEDQFNYQANDAQLRNQFGTDLAQVAGQRAAAQNSLNTTKASNYWDFVNSQVAARAAGMGTGGPTAAAPAPAYGGGSDALWQTDLPAAVAQKADATAQLNAQTAADYVSPTPAQAVGNSPAVVAYLKALQAAQSSGKGVGGAVAGAYGGR